MGPGDGVPDERAVVEDRRERRAVLHVRALDVRVVEQVDVTGPHGLAAAAQGHRVDHGLPEVAQEDGQPGGQRDDLGVPVEQTDGAVLALVDRRGVGGPDEGHPHVLRRGEQPVADDLQRGRVGGRHDVSSFLVSRTVPIGPVAADQPGGT